MTRMPPLFDANGSFGKPATGAAECPMVADRLAHMDRLGIDRALVWNSEATQDYSLGCNRRLLDQIAATPGAPGRIVPSLVVSGMIVHEADGVERFAKQMKEADTRSLRFVNGFGRLTLALGKPVIRAVRDRKPFILLRIGETDLRDILDFTEVFPDIPVVLTDIGWGHGIVALDLMRRRPNILLETSWWYSWDGVRLAVDRFGAGRVLFGTGYLSHNGAAIAHLTRSDISDEQRDLVAHGNLDRLTGSSTQPVAPSSRLAENRLWRRCLAGEPLGVDIVDAHGHFGASAGYVLERQDERDQIPAMLRVMDSLGQRTAIVSGLQALLGSTVEGNHRIRELLGPHADRFSIYLVFNPHYAGQLVPEFDRWFADPQFVGFKLLCSYWKTPVTDPRFEPMWEYANRHRLPVLMHSWSGGFDSPGMTREIVSKYLDLSLILGHSGGTDPGRREAEEVGAEFPNVFLEWFGSFPSARRWEDTLRTVPPEQIVYGTDAAAHDARWELGRLLSLDAPEDLIESILGRNMRRILARRQ